MSVGKTAPARSMDSVKLERELRRLQKLAQLTDGWDGSNARSLSPIAVAHAAYVAYSVLNAYGQAPSFIAPIPDGGVQVEWESRASALELTIGPDGHKEILLVLGQDTDAPDMHECGEALESSVCFEQTLQRYFG